MTSNDTRTGPEQDAIERVARMYREFMWASDGGPPCSWEDLSDYDRSSFMDTAKRWVGWTLAAMQPAPPVAVTEADDDIWRELDAWEPSNVMLMPVYSGEIGARAVIASWQADVALPRGRRSVHGEGTTIDAAIRDAVRNATEGE